MIYTITFNPALDYVVSVKDFKMGMTNRTMEEKIFPGGKGINVSIVLRNLGLENTALGFIAGFTGEEIKRRVEEIGCKAEFIEVKEGLSRINVKLKSSEGTEINGAGPDIDVDSLQKLLDRIDDMQKGDVLVLAGSIPNSLPDSIYMDILERLQKKDILVAVDATKDLLLNVLKHHPFLIKPNNHELAEIFEAEIKDKKDVAKYAKKLQERGARNVLVSMAGNGAVLLAENGEVYEADAPKGRLVNAVGAGDSMVAGFLVGWLETGNYEKAFHMGLAAGSASAFSEELATRKEVEELLKQL